MERWTKPAAPGGLILTHTHILKTGLLPNALLQVRSGQHTLNNLLGPPVERLE